MKCYCLCLVGLVSCLSTGCHRSLHSSAQYANGITFSGSDGSVYQMLWRCPEDRRIPCPLVIHLKNQVDLAESQFSSPEFMLKLGGKIRNQHENSYDIEVSTPECCIIVDYEQQTLTLVFLNLGFNGSGKQKITVDGKTMILPMPMQEVLKLCGDPEYFREEKPGDPHP